MITTAPGTRPEAFGAAEWSLVALTATIWGSSFVLIATGLDAFAPPIVAFARVFLGALTLSLMPGAKRAVERDDWPSIVLLSLLWTVIPLLLFPIAQQWVDSSVAGMINGVVPVLAAVMAAFLLRRLPGPAQIAGIAVGFVGVMLIAAPNVVGADASPLGVGLLLLAVTLYSLSSNLAVPLQQKYGALPVLSRALWVAVPIMAPIAALAIPHSRWDWQSALAMVPLGVLGTGIAFVAFVTLLGRAGATRGAISVYLTPVVAIILGVSVRNEDIHFLALIGSALVIVGAWLAGKGEAVVAAGTEAGTGTRTDADADAEVAPIVAVEP